MEFAETMLKKRIVSAFTVRDKLTPHLGYGEVMLEVESELFLNTDNARCNLQSLVTNPHIK